MLWMRVIWSIEINIEFVGVFLNHGEGPIHWTGFGRESNARGQMLNGVRGNQGWDWACEIHSKRAGRGM